MALENLIETAEDFLQDDNIKDDTKEWVGSIHTLATKAHSRFIQNCPEYKFLKDEEPTE